MKVLMIKLFQRFQRILQYLFYSILSTILDVIVVWIAFHMAGVDLAVANTMGIITGFLLSYVLSVKTVLIPGTTSAPLPSIFPHPLSECCWQTVSSSLPMSCPSHTVRSILPFF